MEEKETTERHTQDTAFTRKQDYTRDDIAGRGVRYCYA